MAANRTPGVRDFCRSKQLQRSFHSELSDEAVFSTTNGILRANFSVSIGDESRSDRKRVVIDMICFFKRKIRIKGAAEIF